MSDKKNDAEELPTTIEQVVGRLQSRGSPTWKITTSPGKLCVVSGLRKCTLTYVDSRGHILITSYKTRSEAWALVVIFLLILILTATLAKPGEFIVPGGLVFLGLGIVHRLWFNSFGKAVRTAICSFDSQELLEQAHKAQRIGDVDHARQIYKRMTEQCPDRYGHAAQSDLNELENMR
jgi:hypothetical protein